jgi:hypothetical protein
VFSHLKVWVRVERGIPHVQNYNILNAVKKKALNQNSLISVDTYNWCFYSSFKFSYLVRVVDAAADIYLYPGPMTRKIRSKSNLHGIMIFLTASMIFILFSDFPIPIFDTCAEISMSWLTRTTPWTRPWRRRAGKDERIRQTKKLLISAYLQLRQIVLVNLTDWDDKKPPLSKLKSGHQCSVPAYHSLTLNE